jgi:hypothetical protein
LLAIQAGAVVVLDTNNYLTVMAETLSIEVSNELKVRLPPGGKEQTDEAVRPCYERR